ncbi:MAG: glycosyltransferase, partial [Myxococcales bacterium]
VTNQLDPSRFEVWYLSYKGSPKKWYRVDRFLHKVPHQAVAAAYQACHLLVKSSLLESFSYPPLEMMATGGIAIVASNAGNAEYLRDRENCLLYRGGSPEQAVRLIHEICGDATLRERIIAGGLATAAAREWRAIEDDIRKLYDV